MVLAERVAVLTDRRRCSGMERRRHGGMAPCAQLGRRRRREASVAVAVGARELADVRGMPRTVAHIAVRGGDLLGRAVGTTHAAGGDREDDEPPGHGALPIG
jgi:hypothetical protein